MATLVAGTGLLFCISCSKHDGPDKKEILHKKITDIIPQKYLDSLKKLGLPVYTETDPPNVEGSYYIDPYLLRASNISTDVPGYLFLSGKLRLFNQHTSDFGIDLIGENFLANRDTSIATAIAGHGKYFTVYGKLKATMGRNTAINAILFSGIKNGEVLDSVVVGLININDSLDFDHVFIKEGQARVAYDGNYVSDAIEFGDGTAIKSKENILFNSPASGRIETTE